MKTEIIKRIKLTATDGMVLTNGEAYGRVVYLSANDSAENWHEITEAEYEELTNDEESIGGGNDHEVM
jgi:hypothetical protein